MNLVELELKTIEPFNFFNCTKFIIEKKDIITNSESTFIIQMIQ